MHTVTIAKDAGACYGVERALDFTHQALKEKNAHVKTLGPLIHNPRVVNELAGQGVEVVDSVPHTKNTTLVIRSHGVVPSILNEAHKQNITVVDATCPYVKKAQHAAERLEKNGYYIIVLGQAGHPEVEGIVGHVKEAHVINSLQEAQALDLPKRVGVVVQTTQVRQKLDAVVAYLNEACDEVCVMNTICEATSSRQTHAQKLAQKVDVMLVIGGHNSANTTHLAELCAQQCSAIYHIESETQIKSSWFSENCRIGISAGASTPRTQIEAICAYLTEILGSCKIIWES